MNDLKPSKDILTIKQNTCYVLRLSEAIVNAESLYSIEICDNTNATENVQYAFSYSFDNVEWSPYSSDIFDIITKIASFAPAIGNKVYLAIKTITTFNKEHQYLVLEDIKINEESYNKSAIKISELQNYRGIVNDYTKNLFKPYKHLGASIDRMKAQALRVSDIFGHYVYYIKVDPDENSLNHTFKLFEKYNVTAIRKLKILIPDNDFKANKLVYSEFNVSYEQDLEIHIVTDAFERAFGVGTSPGAKDFVYVPQVGRMYDLTSAQQVLQLGNVATHHSCFLKRHVAYTNNNADNVDNNTKFNIEDAIDFGINDFESSINDKEKSIDDPYDTIDHTNAITTDKLFSNAAVEGVNAKQLHVYNYLEQHDSIRKYAHKLLKVSNIQGMTINNVPMFFKAYDFSKIVKNDIAVQYIRKRLFDKVDYLAISFWFMRGHTCKHLLYNNILIESVDDELIVSQNNNVIMKTTIANGQWCFICVNVYNKSLQASLSMYTYDVMTKEFKFNSETYGALQALSYLDDKTSNTIMYAGSPKTNIKIFAKNIEEDDLVALAVDINFDITDSLIVDTAFDILVQ